MMTPDEVIEKFEHETPMGLKPEDGMRRRQLFTRNEVEVLVREVRRLKEQLDFEMQEMG